MFNTKKHKSKCIGLSEYNCVYPCKFINKTRKYCRISTNLIKTEPNPMSIKQYIIKSQFSPKYNLFANILKCSNVSSTNIKNNTIKLKLALPTGECVTYTDNRVTKIFLSNLAKHNLIKYTDLLGPRQSMRNCWFNVGLMIHYVSDNGRKYNKYLRQIMITGKLPNINPLPHRFHKTLFLLNIVIESILNGDPFSYIINTNAIIKRIHNDIPNKHKIYNVDENGNPFHYQMALLNYIHGVKNRFFNGNVIYANPTQINSLNNHTLWVKLYDMNNVNNKQLTLSNTYGYTFTLDAVLLRDCSKNHFCCFITINGIGYSYDGDSIPSIKQFDWKKYINKNVNIHISSTNKHIWNFMKGYQVLVYYIN